MGQTSLDDALIDQTATLVPAEGKSLEIEQSEIQKKAHLESTFQESQNETNKPFSINPLLGVFLFIVCIISGGSITPLVGALSANSVLLQYSWRWGVSALVYLPINISNYKKAAENEKYKYSFNYLCSKRVVQLVLVNAFLTMGWMLLCMYSSVLYSYMLADVLVNLHSFYILIWGALKGKSIKRGEWIGMIISACGAFVIVIGANNNTAPGKDFTAALIIGLIGALFGACTLGVTEKIEETLPIDLCILLNSALIWLVLFPIAGMMPGSTWDFDPESGVFGFFQPQNFYLCFLLAIVALYIFYNTMVISMKFLGSFVMSLGLLFCPVVVAFEAYLLGVDSMPGLMTTLGSLTILAGIATVILSGGETNQDSSAVPEQEEEEDVYERL